MSLARRSPRHRTDAHSGIRSREGFEEVRDHTYIAAIGSAIETELSTRVYADRLDMLREAVRLSTEASRMLHDYGIVALRHERYVNLITDAQTALALALESAPPLERAS